MPRSYVSLKPTPAFPLLETESPPTREQDPLRPGTRKIRNYRRSNPFNLTAAWNP